MTSPTDPARTTPPPGGLAAVVAAVTLLVVVLLVLPDRGEEEIPERTSSTSTTLPVTTTTTIASPERYGSDGEHWVLPTLDGVDLSSRNLERGTLVVVVEPGCPTCVDLLRSVHQFAFDQGRSVVAILTRHSALDADAVAEEVASWQTPRITVALDVVQRGATSWAREEILPSAVPIVGEWQGAGWSMLIDRPAGVAEIEFALATSEGGELLPIDEHPETGWVSIGVPWDGQHYHAVVEAVGDSLLVWGRLADRFDDSSTVQTDGWVWTGGEWQAMATSPLCPLRRPRHVIANGEILIWGVVVSDLGGCAQQAAYDPANDRWRRTMYDPLQRNPDEAVFTGGALLAPEIGIGWDFATGDVFVFPETPVTAGPSSPVMGHWVGDHLVTIGAGAAVWTPGQTEWMTLPEPPVPPIARASTASDDEVFVVTYDMEAARMIDLELRWESLPDLPLRFYECIPTLGDVGTVAVQMCSGYALWNESIDDWTLVSEATPGHAGTAAFGPGVIYEVGADGVSMFRVSVAGDGSVAASPSVPVGVLQFVAGGEWTVAAGERFEENSATRYAEGIRFEVGDGERACMLDAVYGPPFDVSREATTGEVTSDVTDQTFPVMRDTTLEGKARVVVGSRSSGDTVRIACDDAETAEELARRLWGPWG